MFPLQSRLLGRIVKVAWIEKAKPLESKNLA